MPEVPIRKLEDLKEIDRGVLNVLFERGVERVIVDLLDRPALNKPRQLLLTMECHSLAGEDGVLSDIRTLFKVDVKIPATRTPEVSMRTSPDGGFLYNSASPDNVNQLTLDQQKQETS